MIYEDFVSSLLGQLSYMLTRKKSVHVLNSYTSTFISVMCTLWLSRTLICSQLSINILICHHWYGAMLNPRKLPAKWRMLSLNFALRNRVCKVLYTLVTFKNNNDTQLRRKRLLAIKCFTRVGEFYFPKQHAMANWELKTLLHAIHGTFKISRLRVTL